MSDNKRDTYEVFIKSAQYNIFVLQIPEDEIDDHLTYLTREKGLIPKSMFDDLLMSKCVVNIEDFIRYLDEKQIDIVKLNEIREEVINAIFKYNEKLNPKNLIINRNGVVKQKRGNVKNVSQLIDNALWGQDLYKDAQKRSLASKTPKEEIKELKDVPYEPVKKFWNRLQTYITVKKYDEKYIDLILEKKVFNSHIGFEHYVVYVCIERIDELYTRLDHEGISKRITPPILVHELYQECKNVNPFLDFDLHNKRLGIDDSEFLGMADPFAGFHKKTRTADEDTPGFNRNKKGRLFKNLKKEVLLNLSSSMKDYVIGQDEAIDNIAQAIQRASVGLKEPDQPIGAFVFAGYSGVGKTYTAKILAELLTGDRKNLVRIDCSEYSADHEYAKLIGAPAGYVGYEQGGHLTNAVKKTPFCVVLFDEVEKASEKVHQLLLQVMDEGRLTDGKGQVVSFKDVVVVMTSNIGVKEMQDVAKTIGFGSVSELTKDKRDKAIKDALKKKFKPEFINRITSIINFNALSKTNYMNIIALELDKLKFNLRENDTRYSCAELVFDKSLYDFIYKDGVDEKMGARPLKRVIEREVSTPLAEKLLRSSVDEFSLVHVSIKKNKLHIDIEQSDVVDSPPFYMTASNRHVNE